MCTALCGLEFVFLNFTNSLCSLQRRPLHEVSIFFPSPSPHSDQEFARLLHSAPKKKHPSFCPWPRAHYWCALMPRMASRQSDNPAGVDARAVVATWSVRAILLTVHAVRCGDTDKKRRHNITACPGPTSSCDLALLSFLVLA